MDSDTFSNNRRDRHFGRVNQNYPHFLRNDVNNNRRTLRETYLNEHHQHNEFHIPPGISGGPPLFIPNPYLYQPDHYRAMTPPCSERDFTRDTADLSFQLGALGFEDNANHRGASPNDLPKYLRINRLSSLPVWTLDENREIRSDLTLKKVVDEGLILLFAMDKSGCHFLQSNYYGENTQHIDSYLRERIGREVLGNREVFLTICKNIFGNFFLQRVIEFSDFNEQEIIKRYIVSDIAALCLDKSACRVVQTALEKLDSRFADAIVSALPRKSRLMAICTDQNANHVIQKVVKKMPLCKWEFLVAYLCKTDHDNLLDICQDKYGCRVVQTIVEVLSNQNHSDPNKQLENEEKMRVLRKLMTRILAKCHKLASNEFANYVIQHIIETPGVLSDYRNAIIENCLLRNLLSMSQEKYASHVVERAFVYAPLAHIAEMMEEIFDGYVPHPDTGKDALDILIFHQFGNYVVQRMLQICCTSVLGKR
uniref:PUM-HD domain-containing protein n=1 Tax=Caenorhabditis japonica TaxID=281687 RepID=A0A8R1HU00_CAEJA